jgi:hypothetical protein
MYIIKKTLDALELPIYGDIKRGDNIKLLQLDLNEEKRFNDPTVTIEPILKKYKENEELYNQPLYEYNNSIKFIDIDVFRQPALTFKETGSYCPFHPEFDVHGYKIYWDTIEYRRKNGMTAYAGIDQDDKPVKVWIPGKHYGFLNFAPINRVVDDDDSLSNEKDFEDKADDDELSLIKLENLIKELNVRDTRVAKKTVDFPQFFDGQYHIILHKYISRLLGKNCWFAKARRKGMSYYNSFDLFDDIDLNPFVSVILAAHDKKYLTQGKGLMRMLYTYSDFSNKFTDFSKKRLVSNKEHLKFGYRLEGTTEERGYLSEALAVSAMNNPDVTIGKDAYQLAYEEMGKFPNWKESYNVTTSTAEAGEYKTGHICGWGTGGTEEANWTDFEDVIYNPTTYDGLACNNIWDDGKLGTPVAYFYAHVHALEGYMDYNGNTNFTAANKAFSERKAAKFRMLGDTEEFEKWCGQRANCPQEAFSKSSSNIFPRELILNARSKIVNNESMKYIARHGKLIRDNGIIRLMTNPEMKAMGVETHAPVTDFPRKKTTDIHGCIVEWVAPYRDPYTGRVPEGLYVGFQDPYAHDKFNKNITINDSLGATYIFENVNRFTPFGGGIPVASWVGRPPKMDYYNEQTVLLLEYYGAKLMFENDRGDMKAYCQARKLLHLLYEEPELQFIKEVSGKTGRGYGMHMTDKRIAKGAIYLKDLLMTPLSNGKLLIDYIFDLGFFDELLRWNLVGNFDRVSAWLIGCYIIKELEHIEINPPAPVNTTSLFNRVHF